MSRWENGSTGCYPFKDDAARERLAARLDRLADLVRSGKARGGGHDKFVDILYGRPGVDLQRGRVVQIAVMLPDRKPAARRASAGG